MGLFLKRYLRGEYTQVWQELLDLGEHIYLPEYSDDATAICHVIAQRSLQNIQTLIQRLPSIGYQFGYEHLRKTPEENKAFIDIVQTDYEFYARLYPEDPAEMMNMVIHDAVDEEWMAKKPLLWQPPQANFPEIIANVEAMIGKLPLMLKIWFETIGEVNFYGVPPRSWLNVPPRSDKDSIHAFDPLYIVSIKAILEQHRYEARSDGYDIFLAPHELFKGDQHDEGGYSIHVPSSHIDSLFKGEWHQTTFVGYLRACFEWGGFPGLEGWDLSQDDLTYLTHDLFLL